MIVDSTHQLVPYPCDKSDEQRVLNLKMITHYTKKVTDAVSIIEGRSIRAKVLNAYSSEHDFCPDENHRNCEFIASFTSYSEEYSPEMWTFARENKGCKIDFMFKTSLAKGFPLKQPITVSTERGTITIASTPVSYPNVSYRPYYSTQQYEKEPHNTSILKVNGDPTPFAVTQRIGRSVKSIYKYQSEIRIRLMLQAALPTEIPTISYLPIPIDFSEIERINIIVGRKANPNDTTKLYALQSQFPQVHIFEEENYYKER